MSPKPVPRADLPLAHLAVPIFLEQLLRISLSSADVFMLSFYSDTAVAAVGLISVFSFFLNIMYSMISAGSIVLMSQYLGAEKIREAGDTALASFVLAVLASAVLSTGMSVGAGSILSVYSLEPEVFRYAEQYLTIYGAGSVFIAFNIVQAAVLRAWGHPKDSMYANMAANVLNIIGNAIALFGPFGLPVTGVTGVAVSTVASQAAACVILAVRIRRRKEIRIPWKDLPKVPGSIYRKLLSIGIPTAAENLFYNIAIMVTSWMIARFGTQALSANTYAVTIVRFVFMPAFSIGAAAQIKVGYLVGASRPDEAKKKVVAYTLTGFAITVALMIALYAVRIPIIGFFTHDPQIIALASTLFLISFLRETGRVPNLIVIASLKGAGDVMFPALMGIVFMWGVGVGFGWIFSTTFGLGLAGVWLALSADEWLRGIIMTLRWRSGAWKTKAVTGRGDQDPGESAPA